MDEDGNWYRGKTYLERYLEAFASISDTSLLAVGGARFPEKEGFSIDVVTEFDVLKGTKDHRFTVSCQIFGTTCSDYESNNGTKMVLCLGGNCPLVESQVQTLVYVYTMATGTWTEVPEWNFPEKIQFSNLAWFHGHLYVLGATYETSSTTTVYQFDETKQPVWNVIDELPEFPDPLGDWGNVRTFNRSVLVF